MCFLYCQIILFSFVTSFFGSCNNLLEKGNNTFNEINKNNLINETFINNNEQSRRSDVTSRSFDETMSKSHNKIKNKSLEKRKRSLSLDDDEGKRNKSDKKIKMSIFTKEDNMLKIDGPNFEVSIEINKDNGLKVTQCPESTRVDAPGLIMVYTGYGVDVNNKITEINEVNQYQILHKIFSKNQDKILDQSEPLRSEVWYGNYLNIQIIKPEEIKNKFINVGNNSSYCPAYARIVEENGVKKYGSFEENCILYFNSKLDNDRKPEDVDKLSIGSWCSFASESKLLLGGKNGHDTGDVTIAPLEVSMFDLGIKNFDGDWRLRKGDTLIGNDVWVGYDAMILDASKISHGAVIGASTVIRGNVGPFEIWIGNPAICKGRRFESELTKELSVQFNDIEDPKKREEKIKEELEGYYRKLLEAKWWYWSKDDIAQNINNLKRKSRGDKTTSSAINNIYNYYILNKERLDEDETRKKFAETDAILDKIKGYNKKLFDKYELTGVPITQVSSNDQLTDKVDVMKINQIMGKVESNNISFKQMNLIKTVN